eukprot:GILJ01002288.1.p1 GENE.GILJ01002288.1~~GILJ01002288.1.p1  ORF type:complete len:165 (-),score=25.98 GILJ01002288.1:114-608(-)
MGDSFSWAQSDADMNTVTFQAAVGVVNSNDPLTSKEGKDKGSTFEILRCSHCDTVIGRIYITTPRVLDAIRDMYTFDIATVSSYKLGTGLPAAPDAAMMATAAPAGTPVANGETISSAAEKQIQKQLVQMQKMLLLFKQQLDDAVGNGELNTTSKPSASKRSRS